MAKPAPLVTQHLENISRKALEEYQGIIKDYVSRRQGVYVLYRRGKLYYIGLASNLRQRLTQHLKDKHSNSWDRFSVYLTIGDKHLKELETMLLRIVSPPGNKMTGRFTKSENLKRKFKRDIKICHDNKLKKILEVGNPKPKKRKAKSTKKKHSGHALSQYIVKGHITKKILKAKYKGKTLTARIRKNGTISYKGEVFTTPSGAAKAAIDTGARNGWHFWMYERSPGDWVPLDNLKK